MPVQSNGTAIAKVLRNGSPLAKLQFNGVTVWETSDLTSFVKAASWNRGSTSDAPNKINQHYMPRTEAETYQTYYFAVIRFVKNKSFDNITSLKLHLYCGNYVDPTSAYVNTYVTNDEGEIENYTWDSLNLGSLSAKSVVLPGGDGKWNVIDLTSKFLNSVKQLTGNTLNIVLRVTSVDGTSAWMRSWWFAADGENAPYLSED